MKRANVYDALVMQLLSFMGGSKTDDSATGRRAGKRGRVPQRTTSLGSRGKRYPPPDQRGHSG